MPAPQPRAQTQLLVSLARLLASLARLLASLAQLLASQDLTVAQTQSQLQLQSQQTPAQLHHSARASSAARQWLVQPHALFGALCCPCKQPEHPPRQANGADCGFFALHYVERCSLPLPPHVTAAHVASAACMRVPCGAAHFGASDVAMKRRGMRELRLRGVAR